MRDNKGRFIPTIPDKIREKIVNEYSKGKSTYLISKELGLSRHTVWRILKEKGIQMRISSDYLKNASIIIPQDPITLSYVAGLFDGEGSIYIKHRRDSLQNRVYIINTDRNIVKWLKETFKGGKIVSWKDPHPSPNRKQVFYWHLQRRLDVLSFLKALLPYLKIKKETAKKAIEEIESYNRMMATRTVTLPLAVGDG
ncbi:MAG: helix-turn-helix domain-containing protein [Candidatus Bathyarchaeia archaeon]